MKKAIVTGITGQDGAYLAEYLLERGYLVAGAFRRTSSLNFWRLQELGIYNHPHLILKEFDLTDFGSIVQLISEFKPAEIYNLAAQSFVGVSFNQPINTACITGLGAVSILEAIKLVDRTIRYYQASTSEMFGLVQAVPQNEKTVFYPRSPYGAAKLYAHWMTVNYREAYGIFASSGILFNHESPLRGSEFVTRKITQEVARIVNGASDGFEIGNLDARRDWGYAKEYVRGMHEMLQIDYPETFVLATGRTETIRSFVTMSFLAAGILVEWRGSGLDEVAVDSQSGCVRVRVNPALYRPAEVDLLVGDASLARRTFGWLPQTSLEELCGLMVTADIKRIERGAV